MNTNLERSRQSQLNILVNVLTNYVGKFVVLGTWFFLTPYILHQVGATAYGIWVLVGSVVSYGSLFDFGIAGAITKYVAELYGRDNEQAHELVATTLWLYTFLGLIVILISGILAPFFPTLFRLPASEAITVSWMVFLSGVGLGISLPCGTTAAILRGLQRFDMVNLLSVTGMLTYAFLIVTVLRTGGGLIGITLVNIPFTLFMQIPAIWMIHHAAPELRLGWRGAHTKYLRAVTFFSGAVFVIDIATQLKTKADEIIVGAFLPIRSVTPYYFAHRLSELPQLLTDQFMKVIMPLASQLNSKNDERSLNQLYLISTRITLAIFLGVGCSLVVLAKPFLAVWVGVEYVPYTGLVYLLTAASFVEILTWPAGAILQGVSKHHLLAPIAIGSGIANLILSLLLVKPLGLFGIALATLIPNTIEGLFLVLPYTLRVLGIRGRTMLWDVIIPVVPPSILLILILLLLKESIQITSFISIGLVASVSILAYLVMYVSFGKNLQESKILLNALYGAYQASASKLRS